MASVKTPRSPTMDEARALEIMDRLVSASAGHDTVDTLAQEFCVISAQVFDGMAALQVLNQHNELMHLAGLHDVDPHAEELFRAAVDAMADQPRDQGAAGRIILTGEPLLLPSLPEEALRQFAVPEFLRYVDEIGLSTTMGIPLKGRAGNLGVLTLSRRRGGAPFTPDDLALLTRMGTRISLGLENLMLIESLRTQLALSAETAGMPKPDAPQDERDARRRLLFDRLAQATAGHGLNADRLAQDFCLILAESIGDLAAISLLNPHNDMLHIAGLYDADPELRPLLGNALEARNVMPRESSAAKQVLETGQPILRASVSAEEMRGYAVPWFKLFLEKAGVSSVMAVPLRGRTRDIGVLNLYRHAGGAPYTEDDLRLLSEVASRMQVALENVLLVETLSSQADVAGPRPVAPAERLAPQDATHTDRLAFLHRLTHMIAENRERVDRMMELASVMVARSLGGACSITLLNRYDELVHIAAYYDEDERARALLGELVRATEDMPRDAGLVGQVIRTGEPVISGGPDQAQVQQLNLPALTEYMQEVGISSTLIVPLKGASSVVGALSISRHRGEPVFTEADREFALEIAFRLAVGLENQQLVESLRREALNTSSAELALSVSEQRFRSVFDSSALAIEIMDATGVVIDVNRTFETMSGYVRGEMFGRRYGSLQHPDDREDLLQLLTEIKMNRQADEPRENRILRYDGSVLWVRTHLAPVKKPDDGAVSLIVALHENITGRKQAEQYFAAVLESTPDALVMVDAQGTLKMVNRQAETLFGYRRDELLGMTVESLLPERFREIHPLHRADYMEHPTLKQMGMGRELHAIRKDGAEVPVEVSLSHLSTDDGPVVVAAIRDITERKKREAALVRSERSLAEAQRVARLGSLEYDLVTGMVEASDEALRILGMQREDVKGSDTVLARMHPGDRDRVTDLTRNMLVSRVPAEFEFRVPLPDGGERIVHDRVVPYFAPDGKPTRILGTIQDVTEQRQAEREMTELKNHLQSSVELERLRLAQELHDGPMQELYGASYRLDELKAETPAELQPALDDVNAQIQSTVSELRAIAKELRPPAISNFGLEKAIRSYMEDFQAKHPSISLKMSLAHDHQMLPEDVRLTLFRVLQQALGNVLRHSQATEVAVQFSLDAEEARLAISDNGRGFAVPPNWMSFVRQGHYGLAGAAERVNALGGILLVDSDPARSTTITAVIPWTPQVE